MKNWKILKKKADLKIYFLFSVTGTFSCTLKFIVKDCDPNTGEADDEGYDDEYVVCTAAVYKTAFRIRMGLKMSVQSITVWHHEACLVILVITIGDAVGQICSICRIFEANVLHLF